MVVGVILELIKELIGCEVFTFALSVVDIRTIDRHRYVCLG
jgi:hypothetical protein